MRTPQKRSRKSRRKKASKKSNFVDSAASSRVAKKFEMFQENHKKIMLKNWQADFRDEFPADWIEDLSGSFGLSPLSSFEDLTERLNSGLRDATILKNLARQMASLAKSNEQLDTLIRMLGGYGELNWTGPISFKKSVRP